MVQDEIEPLQLAYAGVSKISASVLHGPRDLRLVSWGCFIWFSGSGYYHLLPVLLLHKISGLASSEHKAPTYFGKRSLWADSRAACLLSTTGSLIASL